MNKSSFLSILLAFFAAALVSCESDEDGKVPDPGLSDAALSRLVGRYDEARQTADEVGRALGRTVEYESFYVRKNMRTGDARDTLLYVFNYDDNGFAVVATDRRVNKLLAVAENGPYHPKLIPGMNGYYCGMFFYMTALIDELEALSARPFTVDVPDVPGRVESRETRTNPPSRWSGATAPGPTIPIAERATVRWRRPDRPLQPWRRSWRPVPSPSGWN